MVEGQAMEVVRVPWGDTGPALELLRGGELTSPRARTLALDGAYRGFRVEHELEFVSLDHHDNCVRFQARATCEQVRDALRLHPDFTSRFSTIVVNDLDGDTLLSLYQLHPERQHLLTQTVRDRRAERLLALVEAVGQVDALGPHLAWGLTRGQRALYEAYYRGLHADAGIARFASQRYFERWPGWLSESLRVIDALLAVDPVPCADLAVEPAYKVLLRGRQFVIAESDDGNAMPALYRAGHDVVVLCSSDRQGYRIYTIGKRSDLARGNVRRALDALHAHEPGWGGGSSIGGSPRGAGSQLSPEEVAALLDTAL